MAATTTLAGALAAAAQCWGMWDGFLVNGLGRLSADRGAGRGLVLLMVCAVVACLAGRTRRYAVPLLSGPSGDA